jgi:nicotinate-nucleotide pyrophosphorylase
VQIFYVSGVNMGSSIGINTFSRKAIIASIHLYARIRASRKTVPALDFEFVEMLT